MKNLLLGIATCLIFLSSCNEDDSTYAVGDVYLISHKEDNTLLYGLCIHSYSLTEAQSSVVVTLDEDSETSYHLKAYGSDATDFYYETDAEDMTTEMPAAGTYHFGVNFENGDVFECDDILTSDVLEPPVISECSYDTGENQVIFSWNTVENANGYVVKAYKDNTLVLLTSSLSTDIESVSFNENSTAWLNDYIPTDGTTYTVRINAFAYEEGGDTYNIQCITFSEEDIVWGE